MAYDAHIVRTKEWTAAASTPIKKEEVDALVAGDPELDWSNDDYVEMTDDGVTKRYQMMKWRGSSCFWWYRDQVLCSGPDEAQLLKLARMARALSAYLVGEEGEQYEIHKSIFGEEKLVAIARDVYIGKWAWVGFWVVMTVISLPGVFVYLAEDGDHKRILGATCIVAIASSYGFGWIVRKIPALAERMKNSVIVESLIGLFAGVLLSSLCFLFVLAPLPAWLHWTVIVLGGPWVLWQTVSIVRMKRS